jgi:DNA polymerase
MCKERGIDLELSSASAEQVIRGYRKEYASVTALWTELERGVLSVVSGDSLSFRYESALGASLEIARCELVIGIAVKLPSGRELFHNTSIRPGKYTKKSAFCRKPGGSGQGHELYGGLLTENIVQAIARDLLADALVRLQNITIPLSSGEIATAQIVLHVHDEIIWELALNSDDDALWKEAGQSLVQQMIELPPWASGLTLSASGFIASRYFSEPPDEMLTLSATSCSQTR